MKEDCGETAKRTSKQACDPRIPPGSPCRPACEQRKHIPGDIDVRKA